MAQDELQSWTYNNSDFKALRYLRPWTRKGLGYNGNHPFHGVDSRSGSYPRDPRGQGTEHILSHVH